jgi:hypothetical protein
MRYKFVETADRDELESLTMLTIDHAASKLATTLIQHAGVHKAIGGVIDSFPLRYRVLQSGLTETALLNAAKELAEREEMP